MQKKHYELDLKNRKYLYMLYILIIISFKQNIIRNVYNACYDVYIRIVYGVYTST